jgi:hypothetical protein
MSVTATGDSNTTNDTLIASIDIRHGIELQGQVRDLLDPNAQLPCHVAVYHSAYQSEIWTEFEVTADGNYTSGERPLMAGFNIIEVTPPLKYLVYRQQVEIAPSPPLQTYDINLARADVLLVDDDLDRGYESYYQSSLGQLGLDVRNFDRNSGMAANLTGIPLIVWFTGNDSLTTLFAWDEEPLTAYVEQGGRLLLSGQNITDDLGSGSTFLNAVLHCDPLTNNTQSRTVFGIPESTIGDGLSLILQGNQGANNQTSPSSLTVLPDGEAQFEYQGSGEDAMVSGQYGIGKYAFCAFGIEAISGVNNSTTRTDFLASVFDWFALPVAVDDPPRPLPAEIWLSQNYPNPFNSSTTISFFAPASAGIIHVGIYNVLGQRVETLFSGRPSGSTQLVYWNPTVASGWFTVRLEAHDAVLAKPLHLLR